MSYLTADELTSRFGESEIEELTGYLSVDAADLKIADALNDAEATVNSYVKKRYPEPLDGIRLVKRITADIARFLLYDNAAPEEVRQRYDDQIEFLKDVATNKADIAGVDSDGNAGVQSSSDRVLIGSTTVADLQLERY